MRFLFPIFFTKTRSKVWCFGLSACRVDTSVFLCSHGGAPAGDGRRCCFASLCLLVWARVCVEFDTCSQEPRHVANFFKFLGCMFATSAGVLDLLAPTGLFQLRKAAVSLEHRMSFFNIHRYFLFYLNSINRGYCQFFGVVVMGRDASFFSFWVFVALFMQRNVPSV